MFSFKSDFHSFYFPISLKASANIVKIVNAFIITIFTVTGYYDQEP